MSRLPLATARTSLFAHPLRAAILTVALWTSGTLLLTAVGLTVLVSQNGWQQAVEPALLLPALAFAALGYLFRLLRWHLLARRLAPGLGLQASFLVGSVGFALHMTPGGSGEALKLPLLRERTAVPVAESASIFVVEAVCEAAGLAIIALVASLFLPWAEQIRTERKLLLFAILFLAFALGVTFRSRLIDIAMRVRPVTRLLAHPRLARAWSNLVLGGSLVLAWPALLRTLGATLLSRLFGGLSLLMVAQLYGLDLSPAGALFATGSSGFLGGVSMVPAGAGVVEGTLIAVLLAFGAGPAAAVATALTSRILNLWLWVILGLGFALRYALGAPDGADEAVG